MEIEIIKSDNKLQREYYFNFLNNVFPNSDFRVWHRKGFWSNNYIPHTIIKDGKIISNVGVSLMDILINGKLKRGIQLGAVGTLPEFRGKGFSRYLMENVTKKYRPKCELLFLFANDSVMDFYPKFGFKVFNQYIFSKKNIKDNYEANGFRKLNINDSEDYNLLVDLLEKRLAITETFGAINYKFITMWHILNFFRDKLFYLEKLNAIFIIDNYNKVLNIYEIISNEYIDLNILSKILSKDVNEIVFYFPPDKFNFTFDKKVLFNDSPLFILGDADFSTDTIKFPETAVT